MFPSLTDLDRAVEEGLRRASSHLFSIYWERARRLIAEKPIRGWYIRHSEGYMNVAIITDTALLDVEAKEADSVGYFALQRLDAIDNLVLREGALAGAPETAGARMTLVTNLQPMGIERFWVAVTEQEVQDLLTFAQLLADAIVLENKVTR